MYNKIHDPTFKGAVQVHPNLKQFYANYSRGELLKRLLKEPFISESCGMEMPRNNKMFEAFDLKTQQLFVAGIIDFYVAVNNEFLDPNYYLKPKLLTRKYLETVYVKSFPTGPQVLTLEHLEAGFVVWLGCLLFALISFVIEWIIRIKDLYIINCIWSSFYETKRSEVQNIFLKVSPLSPEKCVITTKSATKIALMCEDQSEEVCVRSKSVELMDNLLDDLLFEIINIE